MGKVSYLCFQHEFLPILIAIGNLSVTFYNNCFISPNFAYLLIKLLQ